MRAVFLAKILSTVALGAALSHCSDGLEPSGGKPTTVESAPETTPTGGVHQSSGDASALQLSAFKDTLYPLLTQRCGSCHGDAVSPKFAAADVASALKTIEGSQLVTLETPASSRIVKRLTEQSHNCWGDCSANGKEFLDAITSWNSKTSSSISTTQTEYVKLVSRPTADIGEITLRGGIGKVWTMAGALPSGYGDLVAPLDDPKATQHRVLYRIPDYSNLTPKPQGGAHYYFTLPTDAEARYQLCFRVKTNITLPGASTPTNYGNRVFASINGNSLFGTPTRDLNTSGISPDSVGIAQVGTTYVWMPAFYAPDPNAPATQIPTALNLQPMRGSNIVDVYVRDTEPAIDLISINGAGNNCSTMNAPNTGRVVGLEYDLTEALGQPAKFSIQYQKTADGKAQVFSRPTIETDKPIKIHVEQIYIVINDNLDKTLSTFANVNTDVIGGGALLSGADMILPIGDATDKVAIYFGKLAVVP